MRAGGNSQFVCDRCFDDHGMQEYCRNHAVSRSCSFCGRRGREPVAAKLRDVTDHINACVHMFYDDPGNAGLLWDSQEGGYQGSTLDSWEVLDDLGLGELPNDIDDRLRDEIIQGLDTELWCQIDPYGLSRIDQLSFSWDRFCEIIKHRRRFFFLTESQVENRSRSEELLSPAQILEALFSYADEAGAFVTIPAGTHVWRARYQSPRRGYRTAGTLGSVLINGIPAEAEA